MKEINFAVFTHFQTIAAFCIPSRRIFAVLFLRFALFLASSCSAVKWGGILCGVWASFCLKHNERKCYFKTKEFEAENRP